MSPGKRKMLRILRKEMQDSHKQLSRENKKEEFKSPPLQVGQDGDASLVHDQDSDNLLYLELVVVFLAASRLPLFGRIISLGSY